VTTEIEFHNNNQPTTIVSFTGIGHGMGAIQLNEFFNLTQSGFNVLFVKDTARSWYNLVDVDAVRRLLDDRPVITIGNSMGAFHAAMFALDHPVQKVIAFAAQYSIHPEVVPFDKRYRSYAKAIDHWKCRELRFNETTDYHFISGDATVEVEHLKMLPAQPNIHTNVVANVGHKVAAKLKKEGRLYSMIHQIINSPASPGMAAFG
jgi:hypothetical protein